jgi:hypothetical protein
VTELAAVQVKGGSESLAYGGLDRRGQWREYEFSWLRSLATPLYLAKVDRAYSMVDLFSLWPLWLIFWSQAAHPFEVRFVTAGSRRTAWRMPEPRLNRSSAGRGDGMRWTVHLGRPFLRLRARDLNDQEARRRVTAALSTWIAADRLTVMRFQQFIPVLTGITEWDTNGPEVFQTRTWQFWDRRPGANIDKLCRTVGPMLVNLGAHLQWQDDSAAYRLIPVLEWLQDQRQLDEIGVGLLRGLRDTKERGVGPANDIPAESEDG